MLQFKVLATIANFNRKKSYNGYYKSVKPAVKATEEVVKANKCINTTVKRKKAIIDPDIKKAKKESTWQNGKKPVLLVSTRLN